MPKCSGSVTQLRGWDHLGIPFTTSKDLTHRHHSPPRRCWRSGRSRRRWTSPPWRRRWPAASRPSRARAPRASAWPSPPRPPWTSRRAGGRIFFVGDEKTWAYHWTAHFHGLRNKSDAAADLSEGKFFIHSTVCIFFCCKWRLWSNDFMVQRVGTKWSKGTSAVVCTMHRKMKSGGSGCCMQQWCTWCCEKVVQSNRCCRQTSKTRAVNNVNSSVSNRDFPLGLKRQVNQSCGIFFEPSHIFHIFIRFSSAQLSIAAPNIVVPVDCTARNTVPRAVGHSFNSLPSPRKLWCSLVPSPYLPPTITTHLVTPPLFPSLSLCFSLSLLSFEVIVWFTHDPLCGCGTQPLPSQAQDAACSQYQVLATLAPALCADLGRLSLTTDLDPGRPQRIARGEAVEENNRSAHFLLSFIVECWRTGHHVF